MKQKLLRTALFTSPLLAFYGAFPAYLFEWIAERDFLILLAVVNIQLLFFWGVSSWVLLRFSEREAWQRLLISLGIVSIVRLPLALLRPDLPLIEFLENNPAYPILNVIVVHVFIWIIIESIWSNEQKRQALTKVDQLAIENLQAQKQSLIQQLQPHFLFNALSVLKSLIDTDQSKATNYTVQLSNFLRYTINADTNELVSFQQELQFTQDYIELQKVRFNNRFDYQIELPNHTDHYRIPIFALQTTVENIFKHNVFSAGKPLLFTIVIKDDTLVVQNELYPKKGSSNSGTGLQNLNKRYELIANKGINFTQTATHYTVRLPLILA